MSKKVDLTGERFGKLVVVKELPRERDENGKLKRIRWLCQCDCGNTCETDGANLRGGKGSCGCGVTELQAKRYEAMVKARNAAAQARLDKKAGIEKPPCCLYPDASCTKSKKYGVCCWDCDQYEACEEKDRVCKNSPAKCGFVKNES